MTQPDPLEPPIELAEILAAMDDLGRAKFDAALGAVKTRKLQDLARAQQERIAALEDMNKLAAEQNGQAADAARVSRLAKPGPARG